RPGRRSCAASVWQPSPPAAVARPTVSAPPRSRPEPTADTAAAIERRPASEALLVSSDGLVSYSAQSDTPNRITSVRQLARQCPVSEVRNTSQHTLIRTSETKGHCNSMIQVPLFGLKFLTVIAAGRVGTSNRRHL